MFSVSYWHASERQWHFAGEFDTLPEAEKRFSVLTSSHKRIREGEKIIKTKGKIRP